MNYEKDYHSVIHKHLLKDQKYYLFRAKCANRDYWKYLNGRILEFGCGLGQNIFLKRKNAIGLDISEFSIKECEKRGINVLRDSKKIKDNEFDSILACHVLEHMENPAETLREIKRILKPKGRLLILLPVACHNRPLKGSFKSDLSKHLFNWNFPAINELLNFVGFKIKLNKFNYAYGYSIFYKFPFNIGYNLLKLAGMIRNRKEMLILVEK